MHRTISFASDLQKEIARDNFEIFEPDVADLLYNQLKNQPEDELSLRSLRIGPNATTFLLNALEDKNYTSLDLFDNNIKEIGLEAILKLNILKLNIGANNLRSCKLIMNFLANEVTKLEVLELGDPSGFEFEAELNGRSSSFNSFEPEELSELLEALSNNTKLKYLGLSHCDLSGSTNCFSQLFRENTSLTAIDFSYCSLLNRGSATLLKALMTSKSLTYLNIKGNNFTVLVSNLLAGLIEQSPNIQYINLSFNPIGVEGAKCVACGLAQNTTLEHLEMANCALNDEGIGYICSVLSRDSKVILSRVMSGEMSFFDEVELLFDELDQNANQEAKKISIYSNTNKLIEAVELERNEVNYRQFRLSRASECPRLITIKKEDSIARIADEKVDSFEFSETSQKRNDYSVEETGVVSAELNTDAINAAEESFYESGINVLNLSNNNITEKGIRYICELIDSRRLNLTSLLLNSSKIGNAGARELAFSMLGTSFELPEQDYQEFSQQFGKEFQQLPDEQLTNLSLRSCQIGNEGFLHLAVAFAQLRYLESVDFSDNFVSQEGEAGLSALLEHRSLMSFKMMGNQVAHSALNRLDAIMRENKERIMYNGPLVLENRATQLRREVIRLPTCREELAFLKSTISLLKEHIFDVTAQNNESIDTFSHEIQSCVAKGETIRQETDKIMKEICDKEAKQCKIEQQIVINEQEFQKEQEKLQGELVEATTRLERWKSAGKNIIVMQEEQKNALETQIDSVTVEVERLKESLAQANAYKRCIAEIPEFKALAERAYKSASAGKIALISEYEQLEGIIQRCKTMIEMKPIPRPFGYNINDVVLTRLRKNRKSKKNGQRNK